MLTHVDLFSGIGGFALAAEWAGFKTVVFCEIDEYCQAVLKKHWPEVPIIGDIKEFRWPLADTEGNHQCWSRTKPQKQQGTIRRRNSQPITLITGGFPCQPFSVAGKRRGKADDRYLWPDMFRVISEIRPTWVLAENVTGIVKMELDRCLSDLERIGYTTQAFVIPACAVDAPHRRDRVWIVGYARSEERNWLPNQRRKTMVEIRRTSQDVAHSSRQRWRGRSHGDEAGDGWALQIERSGSADKSKDVADGGRTRLSDGNAGKNSEGTYLQSAGKSSRRTWHKWPVEPDMGLLADGLSAGLAGWCEWPEEPKDVPRVAKGMPERVNKLKALGNAVVPPLVYEILRYIREIEDGNTII